MTTPEADEDTTRMLEIVKRNLVQHFSYQPADAERAILQFRTEVNIQPGTWGDDLFHHEGSFRSAALIHYATGTARSKPFDDWYRGLNLDDAEREAAEYFRLHYFDRQPAFGGFDGHLTNTDAYGSGQMRGVVYRRIDE